MKSLLKLLIVLFVFSFVACEQEEVLTPSTYPENLRILDQETIGETDFAVLSTSSGKKASQTQTQFYCKATDIYELMDCFNSFGGHPPNCPNPIANCMQPVGIYPGALIYGTNTTTLETKQSYQALLNLLETYYISCPTNYSFTNPDLQFSYDAFHNLIIVQGLYYCCD